MGIKTNYNIVKNQVRKLFIVLLLMSGWSFLAQESSNDNEPQTTNQLFASSEIIPIKLRYSTKEIKVQTNDSTYLDAQLSYQEEEGTWRTLDVKLRRRGNNRRKTCYYTPIKVKIKKSVAKNTVFEGNKKLKLVLPCLQQSEKNDNVIKELMAYKMYEPLTPYHFKTRLLDIDYTEIRGKKEKQHKIKGFFIEDIDEVAERNGGKELNNRVVHPLQQDDHCSVQNDFFQFMIGNTDYSNAYQHNTKLIFINGMKAIPVPYDFDLCGMVDASYAVVSQVQNETLPITEVTDRLYRGFKRDAAVYTKVRQEYLSKKGEILGQMDALKPHFENRREFEIAQAFVEQFFRIIANEKSYTREIVNRSRTE